LSLRQSIRQGLFPRAAWSIPTGLPAVHG
jgi:hypothetical protein